MESLCTEWEVPVSLGLSQGLLHKQNMGKTVTLYTMAPSVLFADYNAYSY